MLAKTKIIIALIIAVITITTATQFTYAQTTPQKITQQEATLQRDAAKKTASDNYDKAKKELEDVNNSGILDKSLYENSKKRLKDAYNEELKKIEASYLQSLKGIIIVPPNLYDYKSELLPGSKQANFRSYFVDTLLPRVIKLSIAFTAVLSLVFLIYGGYRFIFNLGNTEDVEKATNVIKYSIMGLGIALFAYFIIAIINSLSF